MAFCLNISDGEYQAKLKQSGISQNTFDFWYRYFLIKYDRPPELDELPGSNSEEHLLKTLNAKKTKTLTFAKLNDIFNLTGKQSIEEASATLNNIYKDLEITLTDIGESCLINIKHRPTYFSNRTINYKNNFVPNETNNRVVVVNMLNKIKNIYGINIILTDTNEINNSEYLSKLPNIQLAKAFIFNNDIYVNTDLATAESPIHEMLHIFLGGMRYTNPSEYINLINKMENSAVNIAQYQMIYTNRTQNDLMEEIFISEFSKFLFGMDSVFDNFSEKDIDLIMYNITRNLDSVLMGETSVRKLDNTLFRKTLLELAQITKSESINKSDITPIDLSNIHRKTSNIKSKLLKNGDLVQKCE